MQSLQQNQPATAATSQSAEHGERRCPICNSANVRKVGPILHSQPALVAGVEIDLGSAEFKLGRCQECGFQFKDPPIAPEQLLACYARASSGNWEIDPDPLQRRFDQLKSIVERHAHGRRILDIGCFNGALLSYMGDDWQQFGVEPSRAAAELARQRGVRVLAADLDQLDPSHGEFDVILAIDLVEHIVDPLPFFRQVRDRLSPNGIFLILTGNSSAFAWRMLSSRYWYCNLPEHVSFYSKQTLDTIGEKIGLQRIDFHELCHKRMPLSRWCSDTFKSAVYWLGNRANGFGIPTFRRMFVERRGPSIQSARDHLVYVYRKPPSADDKTFTPEIVSDDSRGTH